MEQKVTITSALSVVRYLEATINYYHEDVFEFERLDVFMDRCGMGHLRVTVKYSRQK
ncbi:hypothetical protein [Methanolobus sp. WCC4]|uniref:hypothetical protein n=1 Tax=Methanolobus sp. WCC4 TaxID=3125784 RepID=UPI0030F71A4D